MFRPTHISCCAAFAIFATLLPPTIFDISDHGIFSIVPEILFDLFWSRSCHLCRRALKNSIEWNRQHKKPPQHPKNQTQAPKMVKLWSLISNHSWRPESRLRFWGLWPLISMPHYRPLFYASECTSKYISKNYIFYSNGLIDDHLSLIKSKILNIKCIIHIANTYEYEESRYIWHLVAQDTNALEQKPISIVENF